MIPSWYATVVHLGPLPIQVWGLFVALGFLVGTWLAARWAPRFGFARKDAVDFAVIALIAGLGGARVGHILFYEPAYYTAHPAEIIRIWEGGLSSFGGFLGALIAAVWFARKRRRSLLQLSDLVLPSFLLAWFVGRLGCYSIHDHPGIPCGGVLCVPFPDGTRRLDTGLLDGLLALAIFTVVIVARRWTARSGTTTACIMLLYGLGRFALDFLRVGDATYAGLTPAQYGSIALVLGGMYLLTRATRSRHATRFATGR